MWLESPPHTLESMVVRFGQIYTTIGAAAVRHEAAQQDVMSVGARADRYEQMEYLGAVPFAEPGVAVVRATRKQHQRPPTTPLARLALPHDE